MSMEGAGTIMKIVFDGETGYIEQMNQQMPLPEDRVMEMKTEHPIFPVLTF